MSILPPVEASLCRADEQRFHIERQPAWKSSCGYGGKMLFVLNHRIHDLSTAGDRNVDVVGGKLLELAVGVVAK
jgi:phage gpG-like protein